MATMITSECINCGACEPECPNTAIYQGGVQWELGGTLHAPIANDIFYIVPEKCTECVGFHDQEACAAVCPVDCCIPNPDIPETEEVLLARAKQLHPDVEFKPDFPSRFKAGNGKAAGAPPAAAPAAPASEAPAAKPAAPPKAGAPAPAAASTRVEKPVAAPKAAPAAKPAPRPEKTFAGELAMTFEEAAERLTTGGRRKATALHWLLALAQPLLGALPAGQKHALERAVGDRRFFSAAGSTGLNALHNMIIYPLGFAAAGAVLFDRAVFSEQLNSLIFLGLVIAAVETMWRLREGFRARPADEIVHRGALYGLPLAVVAAPLVHRLSPPGPRGGVGQDGFRTGDFDDKLERERRYGEVFRLREERNGFFLEFELPRQVPRSAIKEQLGVPDEMPDYDYAIALQNGFIIVKGKVTDLTVRKVAAVSPAFPPDFTTHIKLPGPVKGFRHRVRGKLLEVALLNDV